MEVKTLEQVTNRPFNYPVATRATGFRYILRRFKQILSILFFADLSSTKSILKLGEDRYFSKGEIDFYRSYIQIKFLDYESIAIQSFIDDFNFSKSKPRVFVIGIGAGREVFAFEDLGWNVKGIDSNDEMLNIAIEEKTKRGYKGEYWQQDFLKNNKAEGLFDLVYITPGINSHFPTQELRSNFLRDCSKLLNPNGKIIFAVDIKKFQPWSLKWIISHIIRFRMSENLQWMMGDILQSALGNHNNIANLIYLHIYQSDEEVVEEIERAGLKGEKVKDSSCWICYLP